MRLLKIERKSCYINLCVLRREVRYTDYMTLTFQYLSTRTFRYQWLEAFRGVCTMTTWSDEPSFIFVAAYIVYSCSPPFVLTKATIRFSLAAVVVNVSL